jgi:hypothetical protein
MKINVASSDEEREMEMEKEKEAEEESNWAEIGKNSNNRLGPGYF